MALPVQRRILACAISLLGAPVMTFAASPDAGALQNNLNKQLPPPAAVELPAPPTAPAATSTLPLAGEATVVVQRFVLKGMPELPQAQQALQPWLNRPLTLQDLDRACHAIETAYRDQGKLIQATVPPQTVENGVVTIELTEAHLGKVSVMGESRFKAARAAQYIFHVNAAGAPLDTVAIEHALMVLNEVPGLTASSALQPGTAQGQTDLVLKIADTPLWSGKVEGNNYGSRSTGVGQGLASLNLTDPRGIGDLATVNAADAEGSHYVQAGYSLPLGYAGMRVAATGSFLDYRNIGDFVANGGQGHAWTIGANLSDPLLRGPSGNVNATLGIDYKGYVNSNLATQTVTSDYGIGTVSMGLSASTNDAWGGGGVNNFSATLELGHVHLNAATPMNYGAYLDSSAGSFVSYMPDNFAKLSFNVNRMQALGQSENMLQLSLSGQLANANLNSAEQFYLGGPYGIRAYPVSQGGGSQGLLASAELQRPLPHGFTGLLFTDVGLVQQYKTPYPGWQGQTNASNVYNLADYGLGVQWAQAHWNVKAALAWALGPNPLYNANGAAVAVDNTSSTMRGWVSASYAF